MPHGREERGRGALGNAMLILHSTVPNKTHGRHTTAVPPHHSFFLLIPLSLVVRPSPFPFSFRSVSGDGGLMKLRRRPPTGWVRSRQRAPGGQQCAPWRSTGILQAVSSPVEEQRARLAPLGEIRARRRRRCAPPGTAAAASSRFLFCSFFLQKFCSSFSVILTVLFFGKIFTAKFLHKNFYVKVLFI